MGNQPGSEQDLKQGDASITNLQPAEVHVRNKFTAEELQSQINKRIKERDELATDLIQKREALRVTKETIANSLQFEEINNKDVIEQKRIELQQKLNTDMHKLEDELLQKLRSLEATLIQGTENRQFMEEDFRSNAVRQLDAEWDIRASAIDAAHRAILVPLVDGASARYESALTELRARLQQQQDSTAKRKPTSFVESATKKLRGAESDEDDETDGDEESIPG